MHSVIYHRQYIVLATDSLTIRSTQVLSHLSNSLHLMKLEGSLPLYLTLPLVSIVSQVNPVHALPSYSLQ